MLCGCGVQSISSTVRGDDPLEQLIKPGPATYSIMYKELNSGVIKRAIGHYEAIKLHECFYMVKEKFEITNTQTGAKEFYINTFQFAANNLDENEVVIKPERPSQNRRIRFMSGDDLYYVLTMPYNYRKNALMPFTSSEIQEKNINSSKAKLVNKAAVKFIDIKNANRARQAVWNLIQKCR